ncbi:nitrilase-related carbon-nitrogen hydrolase [Nonomuraea jabiensis]|uniref:Apolipoprotein N-acyltransferase n=1 Tax=Nonomuraea jabiensis TaxID=882448 RepID=A0A7W9LHY7_9ACTN|nr:nitrilase-related carbon-nitrogen hydrolase [Nonomuraea jabiensis]MBB5784495.1 apolipoprotein N-acyltransferase [Nonomuraea jabiensis]
MRSQRWWLVAAAVLSATLFWLGTGLRPVPWCTWIAPIPVLVLAPRCSARAVAAAASMAWLAGQTPMWGYFLNTVQIPPVMVVLLLTGSALLFGLVVIAYRGLMLRGHPLTAVGAVPAAWVAIEYALSLITPNGAWWSLAYTQADVLPVIQIASATGSWGVTFLLMGAAAAAASLLTPGAAGRVRVAVTAAVVAAVAAGYGFWQLRPVEAGTAVRVALLATDRSIDPVAVTDPEGRSLLAGYMSRIPALAERGAGVVVLPEKVFRVDEADLPSLAGPLSRLASAHRLDIIVGLVLVRDGREYNAAIDFPSHGGRPVEYVKRHLVPGLESDFQAGTAQAYVPGSGGRWAIAICFDLDFPGLVRDYRRDGATALYVPAWDFGADAWLHSRMAVTRGIENGLTVTRASRQGALTVSDPNGRLLAEARTTDGSFVSVTADVPDRAVATPYTRFGDWFAWACALLPAAIGAVRASRRFRAHG